MRALSLQSIGQIQDPIVRAALQQIQDASQDNVINDVAQSGAALSTVKNAAADEVAYFTGASSVDVTALTAFARTLIAATDATAALTTLGISGSSVYLQVAQNLADLANPGTARTNLGLGTAALLAAAAVLQAANNLSDVGSAATARTNLGVAIGTNVQAFDAQLTSNIRQTKENANYVFVLTDGEKHIYKDDTNPYTWTFPANASVAFPLGTAITCVNGGSAGAITLAIASDTLIWLPSGSTGSRTLAAWGLATALKVDTTKWVLSGVGLS